MIYFFGRPRRFVSMVLSLSMRGGIINIQILVAKSTFFVFLKKPGSKIPLGKWFFVVFVNFINLSPIWLRHVPDIVNTKNITNWIQNFFILFLPFSPLYLYLNFWVWAKEKNSKKSSQIKFWWCEITKPFNSRFDWGQILWAIYLVIGV